MVVASGESSSTSISVSTVASLCTKRKTSCEGGGAVTRKDIQVGERESERDGGKEAGRETEGESRCRKSSPSSACHLLSCRLLR